jgi:predicted histone-like DNA-binding protein
MALKVKAVERLLKFDKESAGKYRYVMKPEMYSSLTQAKVIKEAALRSGVSQGVMKACWDAAGEVIKAWATEGHSVALPGLGSMRFGLRSKAVENVNDVKTSLISSRRIIFTPSVDLKDELANTAIQITCIDRNGNEVKRVTSTSGEVEDPENESTDSGNNGTNGGGSNTNGTNGGGTNTGGNTGTVTPSNGGGGDNGGNTGGGDDTPGGDPGDVN